MLYTPLARRVLNMFLTRLQPRGKDVESCFPANCAQPLLEQGEGTAANVDEQLHESPRRLRGQGYLGCTGKGVVLFSIFASV